MVDDTETWDAFDLTDEEDFLDMEENSEALLVRLSIVCRGTRNVILN